jgi:hypothetical protein
MNRETKFLHLRTPAMLGERIASRLRETKFFEQRTKLRIAPQ